MKATGKETAKIRRERLAKELETAYNNGGDYNKVIREIHACGDVWEGRLMITRAGIFRQSVEVSGSLPEKPNGWVMRLYLVKVCFGGYKMNNG